MIVGVAVGLLLVLPAAAQSSGTWNGLSDRFQIDVGYFSLEADTVLRLQGPQGASGEVDFEQDLGQDETVDTFWVDGTWRIGRRHQLKLGFTRLSRDRGDYTLQRDFTWGGQTYTAGLKATSTTSSDILGGYYRFAIVRGDRFEIGPSIGIGYLTMEAAIRAVGTGPSARTLDRSASVGATTGAIGGYAQAWPLKRLALQGDFLYVKVSPNDEEASVTDWRLAADYYIFKNAGLGVQYKYNKFSQDRAVGSSELGGEITYQGIQAFLSLRF